MILLGISGGPDSMYLLHLMHSLYPDKVIVATVNYNVRENSSYDSKIVEEYCKQKNIPFYLLNIDKKAYLKGNFEKWAREVRFNFFKELYDKNNCEALYLAHHKDDFIESYFMQKESKRYREFYGIKPENYIWNMHVLRPLVLDYYKEDILNMLDNLCIKYAIDETNNQPIYTRNKIRIMLQEKSKEEKNKIFNEIMLENKNLQKHNEAVNQEYSAWQKSNFEQNIFKNCNYKIQLVYKFINQNFEEILLSKSKINSIIDFIEGSKRTNKYLLKNDIYLIKIKGKVKNSKSV